MSSFSPHRSGGGYFSPSSSMVTVHSDQMAMDELDIVLERMDSYPMGTQELRQKITRAVQRRQHVILDLRRQVDGLMRARDENFDLKRQIVALEHEVEKQKQESLRTADEWEIRYKALESENKRLLVQLENQKQHIVQYEEFAARCMLQRDIDNVSSIDSSPHRIDRRSSGSSGTPSFSTASKSDPRGPSSTVRFSPSFDHHRHSQQQQPPQSPPSRRMADDYGFGGSRLSSENYETGGGPTSFSSGISSSQSPSLSRFFPPPRSSLSSSSTVAPAASTDWGAATGDGTPVGAVRLENQLLLRLNKEYDANNRRLKEEMESLKSQLEKTRSVADRNAAFADMHPNMERQLQRLNDDLLQVKQEKMNLEAEFFRHTQEISTEVEQLNHSLTFSTTSPDRRRSFSPFRDGRSSPLF